MSEERRYSKESFVYVFGEFLSKSLAFILLPIYASYLSVEEFGILRLVFGLWPAILILLGSGFATYVIRGYYEYEDKKRFIGTILLFAMGVGILIATLIQLSGPWLISKIFKELSYKPFLQYALFFAVFRLYYTLVLSYFRAKRDPKTSVLLATVLFAFMLINVLISVYVLDGQLIGILNAHLVAYVLITIICSFKMASRVKLKFQPDIIPQSTSFVMPLVPHAFASWAISYVSYVFVERYMNLTEVGVYSMAMQLAAILGVVNNGLNQAWVPFVYANYGKPDFKKLFSASARRTVLLILIIGAGLLLFGKELLQLMGKTEYLDAIYILPVLTLSYILQIVYFVFVVIIIYHKNSKLMPVISISAGLLSVGLNFALVPVLGMLGAALAVTASFLLSAFLARTFARRYTELTFVNRKMVYYILILALVLLFAFTILNSLSLLHRIIFKAGLFGLVVYILIPLKLLNLENMKELFASLKR